MDAFDDFMRKKVYVLGAPAVKKNSDNPDIILDNAIELFNTNSPNLAFISLAESGLIEGSASECANFIIDNAPKLSKSRIGELIGEAAEFNQCLCAHLFSSYYFKRLRIDDALRRLLNNVKLPTESQQIDRILEKFGGSYHDQNHGTFRDADTAYVLAFSILMLNTDLHNAAISLDKKMSLNQFIAANTGIDAGENVSRDLLVKIYGKIAKNEILVQYDDDVLDVQRRETMASISSELFPVSEESGWLALKTTSTSFSLLTSWRNQWCCCANGFLYYTDVAYKQGGPLAGPCYKISMDKVSVTPHKDGLSFVVSCAAGSEQAMMITRLEPGERPTVLRRTTTQFQAASRAARDVWISWLHGIPLLLAAPDVRLKEEQRVDLKTLLESFQGSGKDQEDLEELSNKLQKHFSTEKIDVKRLSMRRPSNFTTVIRRTSVGGGGAMESITEHVTERALPDGMLAEVPDPIGEGWMHIRVNEQQSSKRRYFMLLPDTDGGGVTLFFFASTELAQIMLTTGLQCQQGYVRMRQVIDVEIKEIAGQRYVLLKSADKRITLAPEADVDPDIDSVVLWFSMIGSAAVSHRMK